MTSLINQAQTQEFLGYLDAWYENLPNADKETLFQEPQRCALISVDLIEGFCSIGALASPRVAAIVQAVTQLMSSAWALGVRQFVLSQDTHAPDALEFGAWPPHCVRGTQEAETVAAIRALPFFEEMNVIEKNSIDTGMNGDLANWLQANPQLDTFIVVGDCTDLCTYQLAMFLRLHANENQQNRRVIVPADCVQTYDMPVDTAKELGAYPHPGDLMHAFFLYHLALNGVEVLQTVQ